MLIKLLKPRLPVANILTLRRCFISKAQKYHYRKKQAQGKPPLKSVWEGKMHYLQFFGSGANGDPRALFWFCERRCYIFNVGEGTQRLAEEHALPFTKTKSIFVTYPVWENLGGLLGFVLTLDRREVRKLKVHGPKGLNVLIDATRGFSNLRKTRIDFPCNDNISTFDDGSVHVEYVPIISTEQMRDDFTNSLSPSHVVPDPSLVNDTTDYYEHLKKPSELTAIKNSPLSPNLDSLQVSMAYICQKSSNCEAKLNLAKCVDRGVPPGPLLKQLMSGEDVTLPNGETVRFDDVKQSSSVFIVLECPTIDFIESLIANKQFEKYQVNTGSCFGDVRYVIHFTPSHVMQDARYQAWMKKFHENTMHFEANDKNKCSGFVTAHTLQYQLNLLDPDVFPELKGDNIPDIEHCWKHYVPGQTIKEYLTLEKIISRKDLSLSEYEANVLRIFNMDVTAVDSYLKDCVYTHREATINDVFNSRNVKVELASLKSKLASASTDAEIMRGEKPFPVITFLGTGSSRASVTRNAAGILVTIDNDHHVLMDCGEGTFGQLVRHFGATRADAILANTNIIYVSHMHPDHHMGLIMLLKRRRDAVKRLGSKCPKVYLLAPHTMQLWLYNYQQRFEEIFDCIDFVANNLIELRGASKNKDVLLKLLNAASLQELATAYVRHCNFSYGISLTDKNGCKITYSGDSLPSKDLVEIGLNSDLLIHEATYEDALCEKARKCLHSTTFEANKVFWKMNAKFLVLTHFGRLYRYIPLIDSNFHDRVGIAFDNMQIRMRDLPKLHLFCPVLGKMFENDRLVNDELPDVANTRGCGRKTIFGKFEDDG